MDRNSYIDRTKRYLEASGNRGGEAKDFLAPEITLQFPAGTYDSLEALAAASRGRYRWIAKTYTSWDVAEHDQEVTVVSTGTLHGENVHGVAFDGVRYIDRIVYRGEQIVAQQVWNDLAQSGALERRE